MQLVATEDQPVIDRISYQVDAGSHDKHDDANIHHGPGQGLGGPLNELQEKSRTGFRAWAPILGVMTHKGATKCFLGGHHSYGSFSCNYCYTHCIKYGIHNAALDQLPAFNSWRLSKLLTYFINLI